MYKKAVFEKKEGGLSLKKRGGVGVQYQKKKSKPGGPQNEKKFQRGNPLTFLME